MKKILVYTMGAETRKESVSFFDLCWEHEHWVTHIFPAPHMPVNDHECAMNIDFGVQIYFSMQQNSQIYSLRIMSTDCTQERVCPSIS